MNDTRSAQVRRNEMLMQMDYIFRHSDFWKDPKIVAGLKEHYLKMVNSSVHMKTSLVESGNEVGVECEEGHFDDLKVSDIMAFVERVISNDE